MVYYKVVENVAGQYFSNQTIGSLRVEYLPGQFVRGLLGKLFVFSTKAAAERYIGANPGSLEIWECEIRNAATPTLVLGADIVNNADVASAYRDTIVAFWTDPASLKSGIRRIPAPAGSLLAEEVKLLQIAP